MKRIVTLWAALLAAVPAPARAQQAAGVELSAGERRFVYVYRFENDSNFDTAFLVPHFFEQRYEATGWELAARARYRLAGTPLATRVAVSPETRAFGSDFDTFFQPGDDVVTVGTAGDVMLTGIAIEQWAGLIQRGSMTIALRAAWRRDRAEFLPADRVITHTQPASETRELTTDRETTISRTFEIGVEAAWRWRALALAAHASPIVNTRLLVRLPDKYPGQDLVFGAPAWSFGGRVATGTRVKGVDIGAWVATTVSGPYRRSARFRSAAIAAGVSVGVGR